MSLGEFDLIRRYFTRSNRRPDVELGVGDDCALLRPPADRCLAITADTLVENVHFLRGTHPNSLGHKSLAVNLSDLASMGAEPAWATLAVTLPNPDESWLAAFAEGFLNLADRYGVELVGGDTTRGPLSITVQAMGFVGEGQALRRSAAKPGDAVYLTGDLGLAGLGLEIVLGRTAFHAPEAVAKLERPEPRVNGGLALAGLAHACIDISDGLAADLGHILEASGVGATLEWSALPFPPSVRRFVETMRGDWTPMGTGDEYELCFTLAPDCEGKLAERLASFGCACTRIGQIEPERGLRLHKGGEIVPIAASGYQHFGASD